MAFLSRSAESVEAVYARVLDGAHLWLAIRGADVLLLGDVELDTRREGNLLVACVDLRVVLTTEQTPLRAGSGRRTVPVRMADSAPAGPTVALPGYEVLEVDGAVVVRQRPVAPSVAVAALHTIENGVRVRLVAGIEVARLELVQSGAVLGDLAVLDHVVELFDVPGLEAGRTATLRAITPSGTAPVVRARNVMVRPNFAVLLPPMPADLDLRWLPEGRLGVHRADRPLS